MQSPCGDRVAAGTQGRREGGDKDKKGDGIGGAEAQRGMSEKVLGWSSSAEVDFVATLAAPGRCSVPFRGTVCPSGVQCALQGWWLPSGVVQPRYHRRTRWHPTLGTARTPARRPLRGHPARHPAPTSGAGLAGCRCGVMDSLLTSPRRRAAPVPPMAALSRGVAALRGACTPSRGASTPGVSGAADTLTPPPAGGTPLPIRGAGTIAITKVTGAHLDRLAIVGRTLGQTVCTRYHLRPLFRYFVRTLRLCVSEATHPRSFVAMPARAGISRADRRGDSCSARPGGRRARAR